MSFMPIRFGVAQICLNGHAVTGELDRFPEKSQKYCKYCGAPTITACPNCHEGIRGKQSGGGLLYYAGYRPPNHCHECGKAYPWIEAKLEAARELAKEELEPDDAQVLSDALPDLVASTPKTPVAVGRVKRIFNKVGPAVGEGFKEILVGVIAETAKRAIWS